MSLLNVVLPNLSFFIDLLRHTSRCREKFKGYLINFSIEPAILVSLESQSTSITYSNGKIGAYLLKIFFALMTSSFIQEIIGKNIPIRKFFLNFDIRKKFSRYLFNGLFKLNKLYFLLNH
jgi:hypothetical protein